MDISFVLVAPAVPENVGSAARALKTMGFEQLYLVNPCEYLNDKARMLAHGSNDILENAKVYSSLAECSDNFDFIIGSTAKKRAVKCDYIQCEELPLFIIAKENIISKVAIVFGREESGLTNDELRLCDMVSTIPIKNPYPSLNLAQAVMLYAYTLSTLNININTPEITDGQTINLKTVKEKVNTVLEIANIFPDGNIYGRIMERVMLLGKDDTNLLYSFCAKIVDKINNK